jgi:dUTPase
MPIYVRVIDTVADLGPETSRGEGGFGSTGKGM